MTNIGRPTGLVEPGTKPSPLIDGIIAISESFPFYYWKLNNAGDFYTLVSLYPEDNNTQQPVVFIDSRIVATSKSLMHCVAFYRAVGSPRNTKIHFTIEYTGLKGRRLLTEGLSLAKALNDGGNSVEQRQVCVVEFELGEFESKAKGLVKKLCDPLFYLFDSTEIPDQRYQKLVSDLVKSN